jgi:hypothetical protein
MQIDYVYPAICLPGADEDRSIRRRVPGKLRPFHQHRSTISRVHPEWSERLRLHQLIELMDEHSL